jgi:hypothetical protein
MGSSKFVQWKENCVVVVVALVVYVDRPKSVPSPNQQYRIASNTVPDTFC